MSALSAAIRRRAFAEFRCFPMVVIWLSASHFCAQPELKSCRIGCGLSQNRGGGTVLAHPNTKDSQASVAEQRAFRRYKLALPGNLFLPAEDASFDCQIMNLSLGGAGIQCSEPPPLQSFVVLYIDGFGRFEAITTRYIDGELGLRFVCSETKRQRLLNDILNLVSDGTKASTRTRQHARNATVKQVHFIRSNGDQIRCEAIDLSRQGISLRTDIRPPIGEMTRLGRIMGRVVRHHDDGIAIQFLEPTDRPFDVD